MKYSKKISIIYCVILSNKGQFISSGYLFLSTRCTCSKFDVSTGADDSHELYLVPVSFWRPLYLQILNGKISKSWDQRPF